MCEATTIAAYASLAVGAAGAVSSYQQSQTQTELAEDQAEAQTEEFVSKRDQEMNERARAARRERARIRVAAGESGVSGASLDAQLKDSFGRLNQDLAVANKQGGFTQRAINTNAKSNAGSTGLLDAGLQIAGAGVKAYDRLNSPTTASRQGRQSRPKKD